MLTNDMDAVELERNAYCDACKASRDKLKVTFTTSTGVLEPPAASSHTSPKSHNIEVHCSFDMAQQVK